MERIMMMWGDIKFSIDTLAYQQFTTTYGWVWASQKRFGQTDSLQYTGQENPKANLKGVIFTQFEKVGTGQIDKVVYQANLGKPQLLISGTGDVMGYWCLTKLQDSKSKFMQAGLAKKQDFTMDLIFYGKTLSN
ncbi:phage tail protein [Vibrio sp. St2]|uniref:phage tail protein n=1 Tax=Vibrio sp. St2 TaxID=2853441 RepID=UPI00248D56F8|nr:phage tail protein [Vibrio sp. St2]